MPSDRKTGASYHRYAIETIPEIGWRGLMNSAKAGSKGGTRTRVRQMDLASRGEEWIADQKRILQAHKQKTGDFMADNPGQEGSDDIDVVSYLHREAVLLSAPRKWTVKRKAVSHRERLERVRAEWSRQLDTLTDTYLKRKQGLEQIDPLQEES